MRKEDCGIALRPEVWFLALVAVCSGHRIHYRNNCNKEIWVGILGNSNPDQGGFKLFHGQSHSVNFPAHWSGRMWGRTDVADLDVRLETVAEDDSIVTRNAVVRDRWVVACKSACLAFGNPEYCCSGAHNTPQTCPNFNAQTFKNACPQAYSYAYDDHKSTFTCVEPEGDSPNSHEVLVFLALVAVCSGHRIHYRNNCNKEIWVGILGNSNPDQGGFKLFHGQSHSVNFPAHWSGRMWGRTGCGGSRCETGDCGGGRLHCNEPELPKGNREHTIALLLAAIPNVNAICPSGMQLYGTGGVVACKSACLALVTPNTAVVEHITRHRHVQTSHTPRRLRTPVHRPTATPTTTTRVRSPAVEPEGDRSEYDVVFCG
uniref:Uncharacterized protein n=1 Tax=Magallana gigas TaxID=29159 RepID=A0A8W8IBW5_MAGGI